MEVMNGGYAVEYICRVTDETDGQENVPETATMAEINLNSMKVGNKGGKKGATDASESKTNTQLNPALQVAMPVLNGLTDGVAGQVIGKSKQIFNVGKAIQRGAGAGAIFGALAPLIASLISSAIQSVINTRATNDALAESIDATNLQRSIAGLEKIKYTQSKFLRTVRLEEQR